MATTDTTAARRRRSASGTADSQRRPTGRPSASGGRRTTRGLTRTPGKSVLKSLSGGEGEKEPKRRVIRRGLFSIGAGLDRPLLALVMVLLIFGLIMLFSASYAYSYYSEGDNFYYIRRQVFFAALGVAAMMLLSYFDYSHFHKLGFWCYLGTMFLLLMVWILGGIAHIDSIAPAEGEAHRSLRLFGVLFQPSELAKFFVIVLCAHCAAKNTDEMGDIRHGVAPFLLIIGIPAVLVYLENHLSGAAIICMLGVVVMFLGGTRMRYLCVLGGLAVGAVLLLVISKGGYQLQRILGSMDPFNPPEGVDTWQTVQALYAIGSGGFLGLGLGQSRQKYLYLPMPQNDFIFAIICEELGMLGAIVVILLFALLIWRGVVVSTNARDRFGMLLGLGITFQVGIQTVLNILVVTNILPNTGISLPFFSYGGSSLLMLLGEMGVLLNISRSSAVEQT